MAITPQNQDTQSTTVKVGTSQRTFQKAISNASRFTILIALVLLILIFSLLSNQFFTVSNGLNIIQQSSIIAVAAIGETFVIITAGIDLSVGSVAALAGMISTGVIINNGLPAWFGLLVGIVVGLLVGLFNGISIARLGLTAFIVTLVTLSMGRGLTEAYSGGQTLFNLPAGYTFLGDSSVLGIPTPVIITIVAFIVGHIVLSRTVFGHKVYAIGGNREAARLAGINVGKIELLVYVLGGALAALAGLILTGRLGAALPTSATGLELQVIAAVVIGGASLFGGRGNMIGTFFGVLTIGVLSNGLSLLNVSPFWVQFVQGAVIFLAVLIDALSQRRSRRAGA